MALNAHHIDARPSPPLYRPVPRRPGLGLGRDQQVLNDPSCSDPDDDRAWRTLRTGESAATAAQRMRSWFVPATSLSDPSRPPSQAAMDTLPSADLHGSTAEASISHGTGDSPAAETDSMAQLYAALTRDAPPLTPTNINSSDALATAGPSTQPHLVSRSTLRRSQGSQARQGPDWFVSKALARLQQQQAKAAAVTAKGHVADGDPPAPNEQEPTQTQTCPDCGERIPLPASPAAMALHRQSIAHRLGLNAPVSSASASASEANTPHERSRTASRAGSPGPSTVAAAGSLPHGRVGRTASSRWKKLHADNVGYGLLSRMGWKEGMGLGIEEWKWQQLAKARRRETIEAAQKQRRASTSLHAPKGGPAAVEDGTDAGRAIVIVSDGDADVEMGASTPQRLSARDQIAPAQLGTVDWWDNLPRASGAADDGYEFGGDFDHFSPDDQTTSIAWDDPSSSLDGIGDIGDRPNAMTVPIEVDLKADRRGLGMGGGRSGKRRSRTAEGEVEIRKTDEDGLPRHRSRLLASSDGDAGRRARQHAGGTAARQRAESGTVKMTKARRKRIEARKKADWLAVRASLS